MIERNSGNNSLSPLFGLLALCCSMAWGGPVTPGEPQIVFLGAPHDTIFAFGMEGMSGIAVGDFGLVVETGDGGKTWLRQTKPPTDLGLFAVARKAGKCIAGGQQGLVITADDCKQWRISAPVSSARILAIDVNAGGVAYAVGGFGTLLKSTDWGKTWQALAPDWKALSTGGAEPHLYDVHVAENGDATVVGEFEMVLRSRDGGAHWGLLHKGKRSLFGLKVMDSGNIYAVGQEGMVLKATDNGTRWTELDSGTKAILTGIWATPDGQVVASGIHTILFSSDGGMTWHADRSRLAQTGWHQAVTGSDQGNGRLNAVLVSSGGAVLSVQR